MNGRTLMAAVALVATAFASGVLVQRYLGLTMVVSDMVPEPAPEPLPPINEAQVFAGAFSDPLIAGPLASPAIKSVDAMELAGRSLAVPSALLDRAYQRIDLAPAEIITPEGAPAPVLRQPYRIGSVERVAHAYLPGTAQSSHCPETAGGGTVALIVPGSGLNQSSAILSDAPGQYYTGMVATMSRHGRVWVQIKPNEDYLAVHNGTGKLSFDFITVQALNRGESYSAAYLVDTLALAKAARSGTCAARLIMAGVSQGGAAVALAAIQARPNAAVVASGWTTRPALAAAGRDQIAIPPGSGLRDLTRPDLASLANARQTSFLLIWGLAERDVYGLEAATQAACAPITGSGNIACGRHEGGHVFPAQQVDAFLSALRDRDKN